MANEINLITCIEEVTKRQIVMKGTTYVYFDTKENVEDEVITEATTLKAKKETEQAQQELKQYILKAVATMAVGEDVDSTYILFDGNDEATNNIQKAITSLVGDETTQWRVYDNSTVTVNQTILKKVLRKAGIVKTQLWFATSKEQVDEIVAYHQEWMDKFNV